MKLEIFNGKQYRQQLINLFYNYFREVHGDEMIGTVSDIDNMLDTFELENKTTYLLLKEDVVIGFVTMFIHNQYNITPPVVYVDYMYVTESHRSSKAIMMLYVMVGEVCEDFDLEALGCTFVTSSNSRNNSIVEGQELARVTRFPREKIKKHLERYKRRL